MDKNKISVLMAVYKESKEELKCALESIINQTYRDLEIIIVIDYPDEKWREEFINSYNDSRIKLIVNEKNLGLTNSLNKAIEQANGEYIARMDADDFSELNRFESQVNFLKERNYDLCGSNMRYFIENQNLEVSKFPENSEIVAKLLKYKMCVPHPTWLGKSEVFKENNGYRNVFACEDYDFLIRANKIGFKIGNVQEVLYNYRLSPKSISRSNPGKQYIIADFLSSNYRKEKILSLDELESFIDSKKFKKQLKGYDDYCNMKNKRSRYKSKKFPKYYIYTLLILFNLKHSFKDIRMNIFNKYILMKQKMGDI